MSLDKTFTKLIRPMDARSSRGVFSRGKPVYKLGSNSPHKGVLKRAAKRRLSNGPNRP